MLYVKSLSILKNKTRADPATTTIKLWEGVIHTIEVFIPPGHAGLAHLQIYMGGHIILPINEDGDIKGSDTTVIARMFIDLKGETTLLKFIGWNDDDTYSHEFIVRIGVLPKWVLLPQIALGKILESIQRLFM